MHRLHLLRWLALPVGLFATLSITQCVDSLSDDCTKTLTCENEAQVTLDDQCQWRYPDGGLWTEGPTQDPMTARWRWPDGTETPTQTFRCGPGGGAGGSDGGVDEPDCTIFGCDAPQQCDEGGSRRCVECLSDTACAANVPMGDAGAAGVCDTERRQCVQCLVNDQCAAPTPVCKAYGAGSDRNECVECTIDEQCGAAEPACDTNSNECTLRCTNPEDCAGGDKSVCNTTRGLCVECTDSSTCSGSTSQCNEETNECVQCVDDLPCTPLGQVCDETSNRCVQCKRNAECEGVAGKPICDIETNLCVECLGHSECTGAGASRCNAVTHECVGCTASGQCEGGAQCNVTTGACVQCLGPEHCMMAGVSTQCEAGSGTCVECTDNSHCTTADAAHCELEVGASDRFKCVGCTGNPDCAKPGVPGLCNVGTGVCVECEVLADCAGNAAASFCSNGACQPCANDGQCALVTDRKACLVAGNDTRCVECVDNTHCANNSDGEVCKTTNAGTAAGPGNINECVECVSNADCTDPSASRCVQNQCVPCEENAHCGGLPGLGVCDLTGGADGGAAQCVQCTGLQRQACGANVCDSLARTCRDDALARSAALCEQCFSDDHCATDARCVEQAFNGTDVGYFCFPLRTSPDCQRPYALFTANATIDQQQPLPTVCMLRETTCPGLNTFGDLCQGPEGATNDPACGVPGLADGTCTEDAFEDLRCTIPCEVLTDCLTGACSAELLCPI